MELNQNQTTARISLTQLAKREGVAVSTVWRWALYGVRGRRLGTFFLGGRRYTNDFEFQKFVRNDENGEVEHLSLASRRQESILKAERDLDL